MTTDAEGGDVEQEMASVCGVLNASYARLVAITAGALLDESWAIAGIRSPEHWLTMRAGLSPFHARQVVQVARRSVELPSVMGEFANGQLSLDQVSVVARYAPAHVEASVAELAVHASVPQLRRSLSRYSFDPPAENGHEQQHTTRGPMGAEVGADQHPSHEIDATQTCSEETVAGKPEAVVCDSAPGQTEAGENGAWDIPPTWNGLALVQDRASAPAELSMSHDQSGRFTLRFSAPADLGALLEAALTEAKDALFGAGQPEVTWADALIEIAKRSLGSVTSINRRDAYRTYVHLDTDGTWLTGQPRLPTHLADKLTCDGILQPIWHTQGAPVNVGRAQRIVPTRTRRLIEDRDRGCRLPGCNTTTHLECHHLTHWADGGPTNTTNLAALCTYHHDTHHNREYTITGDANNPAGLTFTTRAGNPIRPDPTFTTPTKQPPPDPTGPTGSPDSPGSEALPSTPPPTKSYPGPTGDVLNLRWCTFHEPPDPRSSQSDPGT